MMALFGYFLGGAGSTVLIQVVVRHFLSERAKRENRCFEEQKEAYSAFLQALRKFQTDLDVTKSEAQLLYWASRVQLVCSDSVFILVDQLLGMGRKSFRGRLTTDELIWAMRRDLGVSRPSRGQASEALTRTMSKCRSTVVELLVSCRKRLKQYGWGFPRPAQEDHMKKDWTIIRAVLLKLEAAPVANAVVRSGNFPEFDEQEVAYNIRLLLQDGLIDGNVWNSSDGDGRILEAIARSLTNRGHDLLDTIRHESVWTKIQDRFRSNGLDMTFDLVQSVGKSILERMLLGNS